MANRRKNTTNLRCTVCQHPQRHAVEMAHVAGCSLDALAKKFSTSEHRLYKSSLHRHFRSHVSESAKADYLAATPLAELAERASKEGLSLLSYLGLVRSIVIKQLLIASDANDGNRVAVLAGRAVEILRELGKLSGELRDVATTLTINNNVVMNMPVFVSLQAMLVEKLADHPEALQKVIDGLHELEALEDGPPSKLPPRAAANGLAHA